MPGRVLIGSNERRMKKMERRKRVKAKMNGRKELRTEEGEKEREREEKVQKEGNTLEGIDYKKRLRARIGSLCLFEFKDR